MFAVNFVVKD